MTFDRAIFWSGLWNVGLGLILVTPPITDFLGVHIPNPFWPCIVAAFLWYTSATLILSSQDVQKFASIIYWEADFDSIGKMLNWLVGTALPTRNQIQATIALEEESARV